MKPITVSMLTQRLSEMVARGFSMMEVEGEVQSLTVAGSGHCYLTLAEGRDQLGVVMYRDEWRRSRYHPKVGQRAVVRGRLNVYGPRSTYSLKGFLVRPAGLGELQQELERRRKRLEADGLLDPARKRALPVAPRVVGVATSLRGAALQDFLAVSAERFPSCRVLVSDCVVQGELAPSSVVRAIDLLIEDGRSEVIVVTRGGGAASDLLAFHDEQLARFIARCPIPVVSAVGHQIDTTLCDLVADVVVPTPTAAAVRVLPDGPQIARLVDDRSQKLASAMARRLDRERHALVSLERRLRHPSERLLGTRRRARELEQRLDVAIVRLLEQRRQRLTQQEEALARVTRRTVEVRRHRLATFAGRLDALSPLAVLGRGYAIVQGPGGVVRRPADVRSGDPLQLRVEGGTIAATAD